MNHNFRLPAFALLAAATCAPAWAQYANEFTPARLVKQGTTASPIAGSGHVVVQVQVNADGTHKVVKVISSTNPGDNAAAEEIAQTSTYRPAHRGTKPVTAFYDFTLRFSGKSVAAANSGGGGSGSSGGSLSPAAAQIAALIRAGAYSQAKAKAQAELASSPNDESLQQMLGVAAFNGGDFTTAAAAFDRVSSIGSQFHAAAAASFAGAAVRIATSDPQQALSYAHKAMELQPGTNSRFALGVAQLAGGDAAGAIASLKAARDAAMADPKIPVASKVNIDAQLMQAYLANNDLPAAQAVAAQIKQIDPSSTVGSAAMGVSLIKSGQAAAAAKDLATALRDYDQAAALGDPTVAVTANVAAAFAIAQSAKPDYNLMQTYADKAIAMQPNNPQANFAEGIALTGQWSASHDGATKTKAADALDRADRQAKLQGNDALSLQIETFTKKYLNAPSAGPPGGGR